MSEKKRLDCLLFDMGLAESREKAKTLIMMGQVYVDNQKSDKLPERLSRKMQKLKCAAADCLMSAAVD